jgi:hypothetical protein
MDQEPFWPHAARSRSTMNAMLGNFFGLDKPDQAVKSSLRKIQWGLRRLFFALTSRQTS